MRGIFRKTAYKDMANFIAITMAIVLAFATSAGVSVNIPLQALADQVDDEIHAMEQREAETQAAISELEKQTNETKNALNALNDQRQSTTTNVKNLQSKSNQLSGTYQEYSSRLDDLTVEISEAEEAMQQTSKEILDINQQMSETKNERETLYNQAKEMIKGIYESGGSRSFVKILTSAVSPADLMKKAEYISSVVAYEQKVMKRLKTMEENLAAQAATLEEKQNEIDAYQTELDAKQDELEELSDEVMSALSSTNASISSEKGKLANFDAQIGELNKKMASLEASVAAAQAKLAQQVEERLRAMEAAGKTENLAGAYNATDEELLWLAATIQAEAGGEPYTGKLAVGSVIMNRVNSSSFPNTIVGVITQNMQFASYRSGAVSLYMNKGPNSTCMQAAREVLNGARVGSYLFFMTKKWADYYGIASYDMIGNHAFFYRWVTVPKETVVQEAAPASSEQPSEPEAEQPAEEQPVEEQTSSEGQSSEEQPSEETQSSEQPSEPESSSESEPSFESSAEQPEEQSAESESE